MTDMNSAYLRAIQRIAELQLQYSRDASAAMKERGKLIKKTLPKELQEVADFFNENTPATVMAVYSPNECPQV